MNKQGKFEYLRLNNQASSAFLLSLLFFLLAAVRPLELGHDTALYVTTFKGYFSHDGVRFPDIFFNAIATGIAAFLSQIPEGKAVSGRLFLVVISLIESILLMLILRRKKYVFESVLVAFGYGPLIFLDVIREGTAMLFAGVFFSGHKRRWKYIVGAFATHVTAVMSFLAIPLRKQHRLTYIMVLGVIVVIGALVFNELMARYAWYARTAGYLADIGDVGINEVSLSNIVVLLFFLYSGAIGGFTKFETFILCTLYLISIWLPLLYRLYIFYFFCLSCSRDVLINSKKVRYIAFDIGYALILLRFSLNAFFTFS